MDADGECKYRKIVIGIAAVFVIHYYIHHRRAAKKIQHSFMCNWLVFRAAISIVCVHNNKTIEDTVHDG